VKLKGKSNRTATASPFFVPGFHFGLFWKALIASASVVVFALFMIVMLMIFPYLSTTKEAIPLASAFADDGTFFLI